MSIEILRKSQSYDQDFCKNGSSTFLTQVGKLPHSISIVLNSFSYIKLKCRKTIKITCALVLLTVNALKNLIL